MVATSAVYVESGSKRVFACSLAWPGFCRWGKAEEAALATLAAYVPRYALVAARAKIRFDLVEGQRWDVTERVPTRSGGADFGVPTTVLESDSAPVKAAEASRTASLLAASWQLFDQAVADAPVVAEGVAEGRDRDAIVAHVAGAEQMFAGKVGLKLPVPQPGDAAVVASNRDELMKWCRAGKALAMARPGWPPRYAARRLIWHVVDHTWEIEDRRE